MGLNQIRTAGGYGADEAISAFQKAIRRGEEMTAVFFAQEVESWSMKYLWDRLVIIAHEDVGLGDPAAMLYVWASKEQYFDFLARGKTNILPLIVINAVLRLCRAPKSRTAEDLDVLVYQTPDFSVAMPDYALDKHTAKGRNLSRGMAHFYAEGALLQPDAGIDVWRADAIARDMQGTTPRPWLVARDKKKPLAGEHAQTQLFDLDTDDRTE